MSARTNLIRKRKAARKMDAWRAENITVHHWNNKAIIHGAKTMELGNPYTGNRGPKQALRVSFFTAKNRLWYQTYYLASNTGDPRDFAREIIEKWNHKP